MFTEKRIIILIVIIFLVISSVRVNAVDKKEFDTEQILRVISAVYKEDTKTFFRFGIRESNDQRILYYKKFFTDKAAHEMMSDFAWKLGSVEAVYDPRYGNVVAPDESDREWYKHHKFKVEVSTINFSNPIINGSTAIVIVDSKLKDALTSNLTEFILKEVDNMWKIDNFSWGYKEDYDGKINRGFTTLR